MISVDAYAKFVNLMLFSFGLIFEMPVIVFLLTKIGILNAEFLIKNRGILIVLFFIAAAFITPPDVISQFMLALPMIVLLQISIGISKIANKQFIFKKINLKRNKIK